MRAMLLAMLGYGAVSTTTRLGQARLAIQKRRRVYSLPNTEHWLRLELCSLQHPTQLRQWVRDFAADRQQAFPGHGQMKPEQAEIARLKREVTKLKAERDILKKAAAYFAKEST